MVQTRTQKKSKTGKCIKPKKHSESEIPVVSLSDPESDSDESNLSDCDNDISEYESEEASSEEESSEEPSSEEPSSEEPSKRSIRANNLSLMNIKPPLSRSSTRSMNLPKSKPSGKQVCRKRKHKDDSDNSDIDLAECSSVNGDPTYLEHESYQNCISEIVESMIDDTQDQMQIKKAYLRAKKWKQDLHVERLKNLNLFIMKYVMLLALCQQFKIYLG